LSFAWYEELERRLREGERGIVLYQGLPNRFKWLVALTRQLDPDTVRYERKSFLGTWQKRHTDYVSGHTSPWDYGELRAMLLDCKPTGLGE
jgi:hypothetical protein